MRTFDFCFLAAAAAGLTGMGLGIYMGIAQDFTLSPAHAHLNLLGWVTLTLYGLYHRGAGRSRGLVVWTQVLLAATGAVAMSGGLGFYLGLGDDRFMPVVVVGSLLTLTGMALFLGILIADMLRVRVPVRQVNPYPG